MSKLSFKDLSFAEQKDSVRVWFLKTFYFEIPRMQGLRKAAGHSIEFTEQNETVARRNFQRVLDDGFRNLMNSVNGKPTVYVHRNSGIPLIGNVSFGIVDRNTNLIEVKPITGCNLNCMYCSVDESKRSHDFVVEEAYLVEELRRLIDFKEAKCIEIHINSHGEPLYYAPLPDFVRHISEWPEITTISIDTNATLLTERKVDELVSAGLTRFNVSLNALDAELAKRIAGANYPVENVKRICCYIAKKSRLLIAPVLIPGVNEGEMPKLVEFAKSLNAKVGIQNFLNYKYGRNPVKAMGMEKFFDAMRELESKEGIKLILEEGDFGIIKTKNLMKPFRKGDKVRATVVCPGRMANKVIAAAKGRTITVANCSKTREIKVRISGDKHNIFYGTLAR